MAPRTRKMTTRQNQRRSRKASEVGYTDAKAPPTKPQHLSAPRPELPIPTSTPKSNTRPPERKQHTKEDAPARASTGPLGSPKGTQLVADRGESNETLADPINLDQM